MLILNCNKTKQVTMINIRNNYSIIKYNTTKKFKTLVKKESIKVENS